MAHTATEGLPATGSNRVAELARFFPEATPVRLPVLVVGRNLSSDSSKGFEENTIIEYGTSREVLFSCSTHLEFGDVVRLSNADDSLDIEASVIAVQYQPERTLVAARFINPVPNWIVKS